MNTTNKISEIALALTSLGANRLKILSAGMAIAALAAASPVQAQYTEVAIGSQANANLDSYVSPNDYPSGGTQFTVAGVPFGLAELNNNPNTLGIVQSPAANVLSTYATGPFDFTFSVPTGTQAQALYCLINSTWGAAGRIVGSVVVTGTGGETAALTLTEGVNIRDCNNSIWEDTISDPTVVSTTFSNGSRLDCQELALPSTFDGDTIASIDFEGNAQGLGGDAFVAGMTLGPVPEPSMSALLAVGIAALVIYRLKRQGLTRKAGKLD